MGGDLYGVLGTTRRCYARRFLHNGIAHSSTAGEVEPQGGSGITGIARSSTAGKVEPRVVLDDRVTRSTAAATGTTGRATNSVAFDAGYRKRD